MNFSNPAQSFKVVEFDKLHINIESILIFFPVSIELCQLTHNALLAVEVMLVFIVLGDVFLVERYGEPLPSDLLVPLYCFKPNFVNLLFDLKGMLCLESVQLVLYYLEVFNEFLYFLEALLIILLLQIL